MSGGKVYSVAIANSSTARTDARPGRVDAQTVRIGTGSANRPVRHRDAGTVFPVGGVDAAAARSPAMAEPGNQLPAISYRGRHQRDSEKHHRRAHSGFAQRLTLCAPTGRGKVA